MLQLVDPDNLFRDHGSLACPRPLKLGPLRRWKPCENCRGLRRGRWDKLKRHMEIPWISIARSPCGLAMMKPWIMNRKNTISTIATICKFEILNPLQMEVLMEKTSARGIFQCLVGLPVDFFATRVWCWSRVTQPSANRWPTCYEVLRYILSENLNEGFSWDWISSIHCVGGPNPNLLWMHNGDSTHVFAGVWFFTVS